MARMLFVSFARYHRYTCSVVLHIFTPVFILAKTKVK